MALTATQLEELAAWCATCADFDAIRRQARRTFFAEDDDRPVAYWEGAGDHTSRERRFLGWFMFSFRLPDGMQPAEYALQRMSHGEAFAQAQAAVRSARYVTAVIASVVSGRGALLELEDERFDVRSRPWGRMLRRGGTMMAHLVPVRSGVWLPAPGWIEWPLAIGPGLRREMQRLFQPNPLEVERLLQRRADARGETAAEERLQDATLEQAVARMTDAAQRAGRDGLMMTPEAWRALVVSHLSDADFVAFVHEVTERAGPATSVDELNHWLALAQNIWNATPQPDRGAKTAYELSRERAQAWANEDDGHPLDTWRGSALRADDLN